MNSIYGRRGLTRPKTPFPQPLTDRVPIASESLMRVLRHLYVAGTDSGVRVRHCPTATTGAAGQCFARQKRPAFCAVSFGPIAWRSSP
jgi:hypothetical protein